MPLPHKSHRQWRRHCRHQPLGERGHTRAVGSQLETVRARGANIMTSYPQHCPACGSHRAVSGRLTLGDGILPGFVLTETKPSKWWSWESGAIARGFEVFDRQPGSATVCMDCGRVSASLAVDLKAAWKVVDKWGTEALKARLVATSSLQ